MDLYDVAEKYRDEYATAIMVAIGSCKEEDLQKVKDIENKMKEELNMEHLEQNKDLTKKKIDFWKEKGANQPGPGVKKRHNLIADIVKKYAPNMDSNVLDIGGREGFLCDALKDKGFKSFYIVDISEEAIEYAKQRGYNGRVMNVEEIVSKQEVWSFDIVIASHVIEHCKEPDKIIEGVYNILKPNGIFFIEVPKQAKEKVPTKFGHWYLFSHKDELTELFDDRWELLFINDAPIRAVYKKK
jgi:2-polyprenyl-3-methyl-5-hydroxy-6-metoxy-1,4-benzoquinol methylase